MSDLVRSYDPSEGKGNSPVEGTIRQAYKTLLARGEEERARELAETDPVSKQSRKAKQIREFDPEFDKAFSTSRLRVLETYEDLLDAGRDDDAEELRFIDNLNSQKRRAHEFKQEIGEESGTYERDGI